MDNPRCKISRGTSLLRIIVLKNDRVSSIFRILLTLFNSNYFKLNPYPLFSLFF